MKKGRDSSGMGKAGMSRRAFMERVSAAGLGVVSMKVGAETPMIGAPLGFQAPAHEASAIGKLSAEASCTSLDGTWKLFYFPQGKHQIVNPGQLKTLRLASIDATVPGEVALDLSRKGELPADLFYGENILDFGVPDLLYQ